MALRTIRIQGDPVLTKKCREITEITPKIRELAEDMLDTMYEANGVGLAGPQVGVLKRIVVSVSCSIETLNASSSLKALGSVTLLQSSSLN